MAEVNNPYYREKPLKTGSDFIGDMGGVNMNLRQPQSSEIVSSDYSNNSRLDFGQYAQGISSGLSAGAANSQPISDFSVDPYAGFKGSGQGFMGGGAIGAIIGGVGAQYGQFKKINENLKNLDTSVQGVSYDAYGRPVYQGGAVSGAQANLNSLDEGLASIEGVKYKGQINAKNLDPATQIFAKLSGTEKKMRRKRRDLLAGIQRTQQEYNTADQRFRDQSIQRNEYLERMSNNRLYNLYR